MQHNTTITRRGDSQARQQSTTTLAGQFWKSPKPTRHFLRRCQQQQQLQQQEYASPPVKVEGQDGRISTSLVVKSDGSTAVVDRATHQNSTGIDEAALLHPLRHLLQTATTTTAIATGAAAAAAEVGRILSTQKQQRPHKRHHHLIGGGEGHIGDAPKTFTCRLD